MSLRGSGCSDFRPPGEIAVPSDDEDADHMEERLCGKRPANEAESPSTRRRADKTTGITMDGIRALLQQQTQDLRESQAQEMTALKTATFRELTTIRKEVRVHGDYIEQLRQTHESIESRLSAIESGRAGVASDAPSSGVNQPNLLVLGGWPQDTPKDTLLKELSESLEKIGIQDEFQDCFCTGPKRGFALSLVKNRPGESPQDLKRRLIALAQQIRFAAVQAHSMENGKHLRASLGKSRQERLLSNHIAKTKRLILTVKPGESGKVEADYSASNIWYQNNLVASASRPKPNALVDQGHAPRSWIDLVLLSKLLHVDTSELREQWADLIGPTP